jgi:ribonuclease PH
VQGTAEGDPFPRGDLDRMIDLGMAGIETLLAVQANALRGE